MSNIINKIKREKPLVHHITNFVTTGDAADVTLYWGGLPVMAFHKDEVEEMVEGASALVLNLGAMDGGDDQIEAMKRAGKRANKLGIPVVFDPVGVGATGMRTNLALEFLTELDFAVIKGNEGEITVLAGGQGEVKGVESVGDYSEIARDAKKLAKVQNAVVVVSRAKDIVTNGEKVYQVENGDPLMGEVVGTGCVLGSTLGVFCGVSSDYLTASLKAVSAFGIAGERASKEVNRPASYKVAFQDNISQLTDQDLEKRKKVIEIEG